ncbi:uncharacterized protein [Primulina eburnea]|uniref:uncharacterized protein isoform X1 n=1 Tax=Primulina eburnea TaxID=1245227 RepID=UPI003C6C65EE
MKILAAYLLAVLGGNTYPSADDLKDILCSVGAEAGDDRIEFFLSQVKGKDITELIAAGREKLASVPAGGGGVAVAAPTSDAGGAAVPVAAAAKKEEKVEEKEESDDVSYHIALLCEDDLPSLLPNMFSGFVAGYGLQSLRLKNSDSVMFQIRLFSCSFVFCSSRDFQSMPLFERFSGDFDQDFDA